MKRCYKQTQEDRNILHEIKMKANWNGHILRRNCLQKQVIQGKIQGGKEETGRRGRRSKHLLDVFNLLKRSGFFTYHQFEHSKILHGVPFAFSVL